MTVSYTHLEPAYLAGKSGIEIVREIISETKGQLLQTEPQEHYGRSKEYWIGWAVAYYQWYSGRKYSDIFKGIDFEAVSYTHLDVYKRQSWGWLQNTAKIII